MIKKICVVFENFEDFILTPEDIFAFSIESSKEIRDMHGTYKYIDSMELVFKDSLPDYEKITERLKKKDITQIIINDNTKVFYIVSENDSIDIAKSELLCTIKINY